MPSGRGRITRVLKLQDEPLATAEFLVIDTETTGLGGEACEMTRLGALLAPRARRRRDLRTRALRAVPAAVRQRFDDRRRSRDAQASTKAPPATAEDADRARAFLSASARLRRASARPGGLPVSRRRRADAVR